MDRQIRPDHSSKLKFLLHNGKLLDKDNCCSIIIVVANKLFSIQTLELGKEKCEFWTPIYSIIKTIFYLVKGILIFSLFEDWSTLGIC